MSGTIPPFICVPPSQGQLYIYLCLSLWKINLKCRDQEEECAVFSLPNCMTSWLIPEHGIDAILLLLLVLRSEQHWRRRHLKMQGFPFGQFRLFRQLRHLNKAWWVNLQRWPLICLMHLNQKWMLKDLLQTLNWSLKVQQKKWLLNNVLLWCLFLR